MTQKMIGLLLMLASLKLFSQQSLNFGIIYGQRLNYRTAPFFDLNSVTGISIEYKLPMETKVDFRLSGGIEKTSYLTLPNGFDVYRHDYVVIPFRVGLQPYIYKDKAFIFGESGLTIKMFPFDELSGDYTRLGFSLALGGGYRFSINKRKYIQTSISYNYIPNRNFYNFSWINLRLAYGLKWGNDQ